MEKYFCSQKRNTNCHFVQKTENCKFFYYRFLLSAICFPNESTAFVTEYVLHPYSNLPSLFEPWIPASAGMTAFLNPHCSNPNSVILRKQESITRLYSLFTFNYLILLQRVIFYYGCFGKVWNIVISKNCIIFLFFKRGEIVVSVSVLPAV